MYSDTDVARLRLLRAGIDRGHSIGRLAGLDDSELRQLAETTDATALRPGDPLPRPALDTGLLTAALRRYDAVAIEQEIARLAAVLPAIDLLREVIMPTLVRVGDDWYRGRASIAQEHLMSAAVKRLLGSFIRLHARRDVPARLLFATLAGDRHEIGTLGAAMLAASSGLGVTYLGPDLPAHDIVTSVQPAGAQVLVLGLTMPSTGKVKERELRTIVRELPEGTELWAGGRGAARYASIITPRGIVLDDYGAYQQELLRLGGRAA
jgi:methanogenic corrinoid protein MtbC1